MDAMKRACAILLGILLCTCQPSRTDDPKKEPERKKTTAEQAFDAGQRARKKAEAIKEEQDKKAKETDDIANEP